MVTTIEKTQQAILSRIELHGIEGIKTYFEALPPMSVERHSLERIFAQLVQDQSGKWSFKK